MNKNNIIIVLVFLSANVFAQKSIKDSGLVVLKKNELVLETTANLTKLNTPSGFMYRRNFKNKISARVKLNGTYGDSRQSSANVSNKNYSYSGSIGLQKNVAITKICQFYWGADVAYSHKYSSSSDTSETIVNTTNTVELDPLVGVKFTFKNRFILGVENLGSYSYKMSSNKQTYTDLLIFTNAKTSTAAFSFAYSKTVLFYVGFNF
jgi:hypothetical protein